MRVQKEQAGELPTNHSHKSSKFSFLPLSWRLGMSAVLGSVPMIAACDAKPSELNLSPEQIHSICSQWKPEVLNSRVRNGLEIVDKNERLFGDEVIKELSTGVEHPLGNIYQAFSRAGFSPDGKLIAMVLTDTRDRMVVLNLDRTLYHVYNTRSAGIIASTPTWSADGKTIVAIRGTNDTQKSDEIELANVPQIDKQDKAGTLGTGDLEPLNFEINIPGYSPRTELRAVDISPNKSKLAVVVAPDSFTHQTNEGAVFTVGTDGKNITKIADTKDPARFFPDAIQVKYSFVKWSLDGSLLSYLVRVHSSHVSIPDKDGVIATSLEGKQQSNLTQSCDL